MSPSCFAYFPENLPHSKYIGAKVAVLAICTSGADGGRLRKYLVLNHGVHGGKSGTGFGEKDFGHGESQRDVIRDDKDVAGGDRLGKLLRDKQGVSRQLKQMIVMRPSSRVFEINGIACIFRLDQQVKLAG